MWWRCTVRIFPSRNASFIYCKHHINFSQIINYAQPLNIYSAPSSSSSIPSNNTGGRSKNNNRGRFLQLASSSLRRSHHQKTKSNASSATAMTSSNNNNNNNNSRGSFHRLSPLKENSVGAKYNAANNQYSHPPQKQQQQKSIPTGTNSTNNNDLGGPATMFSQAELYDIEESFKLFDIHGEGIVQVGDLRSILSVLEQEQQQHQQQSMTSHNYPHLNTLLYQLSELSDEDNLTLNEYVQLMANTTNNNEENDEDDDNNNHFIRVFRLFDTDEKGYITVNDLQRVAIELGEHDMTIDEIQEMIDRAKQTNHNNVDHDDNGKVNIDDFIQMMTMSLFPRGTRTVGDGEEEGEV